MSVPSMSDRVARRHGLHAVHGPHAVPLDGPSPPAEAPELSLPYAVSVLADEPAVDWPSRVHPALVAVARGVHEHSSRAGRAALLPMAPTLLDTARPGLETSAMIVATCTSTALTSPDAERITEHEYARLQADHRTAAYLLQRAGSDGSAETTLHTAGERRPPVPRWVRVLWWVGLTEPLYRRFSAPDAAAHAVAVTARASGGACDQCLRRLLRRCVALVPTPARCAADVTASDQGAFRRKRPGKKRSGP